MADQGFSSDFFDDAQDVRAYALERVSEFIARQYPDLNALDASKRASIVDDGAERLSEAILEKIDAGEPIDLPTLSAGLIREFLARRGFKANSGQQQQRARPAKAKPVRPEKPLGSPTPFVWQKPKRREWLHANHYIRKYVTATVSPGGVGKSSLAIVEALAMVTGRVLPFCMFQFGSDHERLRVWYVNGEDPLDEVYRRFAAAMQHFGIEPEDVEGRLFVDTGREKDFVFARDKGKEVALAEPLVDSVIAGIKKNGIDVLILDPFVAFHLLPEIDNTKINQVVRVFADIADETNTGVELVAHTRKTMGNEVGIEDARGAKALVDGARSVRLVNPMTESEGDKAGLLAGEFMSIIRLDNGKQNMVKGGNDSTWRRMVSVTVECEDGYRENVGVCDAWSWPRVEDDPDAGEAPTVSGPPSGRPKVELCADDLRFLADVHAHIATGRSLSAQPQAPNYAPKVLAKPGKGKSGRVVRNKKAMENLFCAGAIVAELGKRGVRRTVIKLPGWELDETE